MRAKCLKYKDYKDRVDLSAHRHELHWQCCDYKNVRSATLAYRVT